MSLFILTGYCMTLEVRQGCNISLQTSRKTIYPYLDYVCVCIYIYIYKTDWFERTRHICILAPIMAPFLDRFESKLVC